MRDIYCRFHIQLEGAGRKRSLAGLAIDISQPQMQAKSGGRKFFELVGRTTKSCRRVGFIPLFGSRTQGCPSSPNLSITSSPLGAQRIFSSLPLYFSRSAARTATASQTHQSLLSCTVFLTTTRSYAKKKKMPPKKNVEEKKLLLGRPGNNLKTGIVRRRKRERRR